MKRGRVADQEHDRKGTPVVFLIRHPATRYYQVVTRRAWVPALVDEIT